MTISYLYVDVLEQGDMQVVSKGWCKESSRLNWLIIVVFEKKNLSYD